MNRKRLRIGNFSKGLLRDSGTDVDRLLSLRTLKNYFIDYSDSRLRVRNGYTRWNSTALPAPATQLYYFVDLSLNERLLGITNSKWYIINSSGSHTLLKNETATARRPILSFGNRYMFGTDSDIYWSDSNNVVYQLGIDKPGTGLTVRPYAPRGHIDTANVNAVMQPTTVRRLAIQYDVGGSDEFVDAIHIAVTMRTPGATDLGAWKVSCYTNDGGEPSDTLVDDSAVSYPMPVATFNSSAYAYKRFLFPDSFTLTANTTYFFVIDGDDNYFDSYDPINFYGSMGLQGVSPTHVHGPAQAYDNGTSTWSAYPEEAVFYIGGIDTSKAYGFVCTYYNDTYGIESRPSDQFRLEIAEEKRFWISAYPLPTDSQIDYVRFYRREIPDIVDSDDTITDVYKYVGQVVSTNGLYDDYSTENLGAELQTEDHYRIDEAADTGDAGRDAFLPAIGCSWKGRIWFVATNGNILYFSKKLESDGRTGLTGDSIPDYFPLENRLEINESSVIIALVPLSADELAVYFRNTSVWVIRGCDDVQNPPADIVLRQAVTDVGLIAPAAVDSIRGRHVFLSRKGLYDFKGSPQQEYLSDGIQTILDEIDDSYLDDSVLVTMGDSIWLAVDEDEDGSLENIYILDIQRKIPAWRMYNYGINIKDMVVRKTGTEYKTLLAADADSNYIVQLESGNTDNGQAIVAELETQDLIVPNLATIYEVSLDAYYPNVPPTYEVEITDALDEVHELEINPRSTDDLAGHKAYPIVTSAVGARVKVTQRTVNQNHLRAIEVGYVER